ncbi:MAG: hypothetical protein ACLQVY_20225, partial [Limisphaerales bacterium]
DYPFVSSCSPRLVAKTQLLSTRGGKHRHRGTSTLRCTLILKRTSATVPVTSAARLARQSADETPTGAVETTALPRR